MKWFKKWVWKQNRKEKMKLYGEEEENKGEQRRTENNDRKMIKRFWKLLLKQSKRRRKTMKENSWQLTTNCSTNHANLLVIVVSHRFLAITNPWIQETIQSVAHKIVLLHSNNTSIPLTSCKLLLNHQDRLEVSMK